MQQHLRQSQTGSVTVRNVCVCVCVCVSVCVCTDVSVYCVDLCLPGRNTGLCKLVGVRCQVVSMETMTARKDR